MTTIPSPEQLLKIGHIRAAYGIKGWVWIHAGTDPIANIFSYTPWYACIGKEWREVKVAEWREQGKGVVARLSGVDDRSAAEALQAATLWTLKSNLPSLPEGDYYWSDLIDLQVWTVDGQLLGRVHSLMETGSNDVLVVRACAGSMDTRERLVPWMPGQFVTEVDLPGGRLTVDWDPDF